MDDIDELELFSHLPVGVKQRLNAMARSVTYEDRQVISMAGDPNAPVLFVVKGVVRVYSTNQEGREQTLAYLKKGDALNLPSIFADDHSAPASAVAVGTLQAVQFSQDDFRRAALETPQIALAVLKYLSERLRYLTNLVHDVSLRPVQERLARFLLMQAGGATRDGANTGGTAPTRWTQEEIAAQIGTTREMVSRTLRSFIREGVVKMERQRIILLNPEALEAEFEE